jgi:O-antigen/teichoic acid export membrane protein
MIAENVEAPAADKAAQHRASFFRHSGWMMATALAAGALTWAVHFLAHMTGPDEYGVFGALMMMVTFIPTTALQTVLAQQTAMALATNRQRELSGMVRLVWIATGVLWLVGFVVICVLQSRLLVSWKIANPMGLWITVAILLLTLWQPVFSGVLQGQQNFLWLGWGNMVSGVCRLGIAAVAVLLLGGGAAGMMSGVLIGTLATVGIGLWQSRSIWLAPPAPFDRRKLLRQMVPLFLGFCAFQFLFAADTMFAKGYFDEATVGFYVSAGTLSRALMWVIVPLATVMFPRIVHSHVKEEKSDEMGLVLSATVVLALAGVGALSVLGPWLVQFMSGKQFVRIASVLLPWYAGAMVPLSLAYILLNNLLARSWFKIVPVLCVLAAAYALALTRFHSTPVTVIKTMGVFNTLLLAACAWFTWGTKNDARAA